MGYRHKIGILDKKTYRKINKLNHDELISEFGEKEEGFVACYHITKEVYCLGKCCEFNFTKEMKKRVFKNKLIDNMFNDENDFYIITREGFETIIEDYRKKIVHYYKNLPSEENSLVSHVKEILDEWENPFNLKPYSLSGEEMVTSWKYEYAIFELVRIYRSIDWDKQYVTITGW